MSDYRLESDVDQMMPEDTSERELVVLLLDTSWSMGEPINDTRGSGRSFNTRIEELNVAVDEFLRTSIHKIPLLETCGEIAIATFCDGGVQWLELDGRVSSPPFYYVTTCRSFAPQGFAGNTPLAEAVLAALSAVEQRKTEMHAEGIIHGHRPNVFLLTDGKPSTPWQHIPALLRREEAEKKLLFWILGAYEANDQILLQIAAKHAYHSLGGLTMAQVIEFVSRSIRAVESMAGDRPAQEYYERTLELADSILKRHEEKLG